VRGLRRQSEFEGEWVSDEGLISRTLAGRVRGR
jgi:hypothetical protein